MGRTDSVLPGRVNVVSEESAAAEVPLAVPLVVEGVAVFAASAAAEVVVSVCDVGTLDEEVLVGFVVLEVGVTVEIGLVESGFAVAEADEEATVLLTELDVTVETGLVTRAPELDAPVEVTEATLLTDESVEVEVTEACAVEVEEAEETTEVESVAVAVDAEEVESVAVEVDVEEVKSVAVEVAAEEVEPEATGGEPPSVVVVAFNWTVHVLTSWTAG